MFKKISMERYVPSFPRLRKSFKLRSREYLRENTLHGFPYFVDSTRPKFDRIFWFLCTFTSLCAALTIIWTIWLDFQRKPTITGLDTITEYLTITLPSINLCFTSNHLDLTGINEKEANIYRELYDWNWKELSVEARNFLQQTESLNEKFEYITPKCSDVLANCTHWGIPTHCDIEYRKTQTPVGLCCVSKPKFITKDTENTSTTFHMKTDRTLHLYLFESDEDFPIRQGPINYRLNRDFTFRMSLEITEASDNLHSLPRYQRACIFEPDEGLDYNNCIYECRRTMAIDVCGCLPWFLLPDKNNPHCSYDGYDCLVQNVEKLKSPKCESNCYLSCHRTYYRFAQIVKSEDLTLIGITSWPSVRYIVNTQFGWLDLLVSFGGIMGLFLGYSILTSIELIYYFTLRPYCGAIMNDDDDDDDDNNFTRIEVSPKPKKNKSENFELEYFTYVD